MTQPNSPSGDAQLVHRLDLLERRLRLHRIGAALLLGTVVLAAWTRPSAVQEVPTELRVRGIVVEDDQGIARVVIGSLGERQHGEGFGIAINDANGSERFGVSHFPDERIAMGFDAPPGLGNAMRDRLGLGVGATGHPFIMLLNNDTSAPLRIYTTDENEARIEFIDWDRSGEQPAIAGYKRYGLEEAYITAD